MSSSSNPSNRQQPYDSFGAVGPNGGWVGPVYGSPATEGGGCNEDPQKKNKEIFGDEDCGEGEGCVEEHDAGEEIQITGGPIQIEELGGLDGTETKQNPFGKIPDTTPKRPAGVNNANTLGGEAAYVRAGLGQIYMVEIDLERNKSAGSNWSYNYSWVEGDGIYQSIEESRVDWGQTRSYANIEGPDEGGINGNRWLNKELNYLDFEGEPPSSTLPDRVLRRGLANQSQWYERVSGTNQYTPLTAFYGSMVHAGGLFRVRDANEVEWVYFDNSTSHPAALRGKLKEVNPNLGASGDIAYDSNDEVESVVFEGAEESGWRTSFYYEYYDDLEHVGMLKRVTQYAERDFDEAEMPYPFRRVTYEYYDSNDSGGSVNDLKKAEVEGFFRYGVDENTPIENSYDGIWVSIHSNFYRYYKDDLGSGFKHGLKYALRGKSYERITEEGLNPESVSDSVLAGYADYYFEYDEERRVTRQNLRGGEESFLYAYEDNPDGPDIADKNTWGVKTTVTQPGGEERRVYTNPTASSIVNILEQPNSDQNFDATQRNSQGWTSQYSYPTAIESITEPTGGSTALTVNYHPDSGLIYEFDFYDVDDPVTGAVKGWPKSRKVKEGSGGTADLLDELAWDTQTVGEVSSHRVRESTQYLEAGSLTPFNTTFVNTYYKDEQGNDTLQIQKQVEKLPVVPVSENGDGLEHEIVRYFDQQGNRTWLKNANGFITKWTYSGNTLVQRIDDVDSTLFPNIPDGWVTPAGGGRNLVRDFVNDQQGRVLRSYSPWHEAVLHEDDEKAINVRTVKFAVYRDDIDEVWTATGYATGNEPAYGYETVGTVTITKRDKQGRVTDVIRSERECSCGVLKEVESFPQKRWKAWTQNFYDDWGRLLTSRVYFQIPAVGEGERGQHYEETRYSYDVEGRRVRSLSAGGTISRTVYGEQGRVLSRWVGTDDAGATDSDPTGGGAAGNNMVQTLALEYDNGDPDGNGLLTKETRPVDGNASSDRITEFTYDYRTFLETQKSSDGTTDFLTHYTTNNVGQVVQTDTYHTEVLPGNLTGRTTFALDIGGRVYQTQVYGVDPKTGTVGNSLQSEVWRDPNGYSIKSTSAGSKAIQRAEYDGLGRMVKQYLCVPDGPQTPGAVGSVEDDLVIEQAFNTYSNIGKVIETTSFQRFHDATGTGPLNGPGGDQPKARRSYTASWHDGVKRLVASGTVGTNGGMDWVRPAAVPDRSATTLITSNRYATDGESNASIDANGIETRWHRDAMGRQTLLIENYDESEPAHDYGANRTTAFSYTADGQLRSLTLVNEVTGNQVTRWVYGTTLDDSNVARADLLRAKIYPESNDEYDPLGDGPQSVYERIEYEYNRQGDLTQKKDPNETIHEYDYDRMGRPTQDRVTALGTGIDDGVLRIETTYDTKRLLTASVKSYDNATVGAGNVMNEVAYIYNDFGQLEEDRQSHSGVVDGSTPKVSYGYADGSSDNTIRRTSLTYPDGRQIDYSYGAADSLDDLLSRVSGFQINGESSELVTYQYVGANRYVKIAYLEPDVELSYFSASGQPAGDSEDPYSGYDRFGRTVDMRWVASTGGAVKDRIQYGYDRVGNRTWRKNLAATDGGQDFAYRYDGLYQVTESSLGTLNLNQSAIGGVPDEAERFDYDPTGNWQQYQKDENGSSVLDQPRRSNKENQLTQIDGSSEGFSYDKSGNATTVVPTADGNWDSSYELTWDAWNRLVEVKDDQAQTVAAYGYDGTTRRITKEIGSETTHYFYNDQWKCLEERVNASTDPQQQYVWGARPGHRDELVLRDRDANSGGSLNERLYTLMEYFNPTSVVDASGDVQERYRFSAFGNRTIMAADWTERISSSFEVDFGFQGQFQDQETGWYNYGFRHYVPELGRWINRDPIGENGGRNHYRFSLNDGINLVDVFGLNPVRADSTSVQELAREGAQNSLAASLAYQARHNSFIEYGGAVCSLTCLDSGDEWLYLTKLNYGVATSVLIPQCPRGWTRVHTFHSHSMTMGGPDGVDRLHTSPEQPGMVARPYTGDTIAMHTIYGTDRSLDEFSKENNFDPNSRRDRVEVFPSPVYQHPEIPCPCNCPDGCPN